MICIIHQGMDRSPLTVYLYNSGVIRGLLEVAYLPHFYIVVSMLLLIFWQHTKTLCSVLLLFCIKKYYLHLRLAASFTRPVIFSIELFSLLCFMALIYVSLFPYAFSIASYKFSLVTSFSCITIL